MIQRMIDSPLLAMMQGGDYTRSISIHSHPQLESNVGADSSVTARARGLPRPVMLDYRSP
jgi:hypothetical protein